MIIVTFVLKVNMEGKVATQQLVLLYLAPTHSFHAEYRQHSNLLDYGERDCNTPI